jgi:hypothetical protein
MCSPEFAWDNELPCLSPVWHTRTAPECMSDHPEFDGEFGTGCPASPGSTGEQHFLLPWRSACVTLRAGGDTTSD